MSKTDFTQFKVSCSEIYSLLTTPKGAKPGSSELKKYERLIMNEEKTEEDLAYIKKIKDKLDNLKTEPLSKTTISALIRQYGWKVYGKKVAANGGDALSFLKKGTDMESEAVELLSKIDKQSYKLETETIENEYLVGRADIICTDKVIDTKISWNVNSFLKSRTATVSSKYWYQMQGYMELYDLPEAEVVFLLLNTPPELIEREKVKLQNRFMIGEIDREKYEIDVENIESAFTYSSIPLKKRYFKHKIKREPHIFEKIYKKVENARLWMRQFEKDMRTNIFVVPSEKYLSEKNSTEPDSNESPENDTGG